MMAFGALHFLDKAQHLVGLGSELTLAALSLKVRCPEET